MSESSNEIDEVLDEMKQSGTLDPLKQKAFSLLKDDQEMKEKIREAVRKSNVADKSKKGQELAKMLSELENQLLGDATKRLFEILASYGSDGLAHDVDAAIMETVNSKYVKDASE